MGMERETNFVLREDVARDDHRLVRDQVIKVGPRVRPIWGIVNGQLDWDCRSRDASYSLL